MRIKLLKPALNDDMMYGTEAVIEMKDEGRAKFFVDMGNAVRVPNDTELTPGQPPPRPLPNPQSTQIGEAVAEAITKAFDKLSSKLIPTEKVD